MTDEFKEKASRLLTLGAQRAQIENEYKALSAQVKNLMMRDKILFYACDEGALQWRQGGTRKVLDISALQANRPDIYQAYLTTKPLNPTLSVVPSFHLNSVEQ